MTYPEPGPHPLSGPEKVLIPALVICLLVPPLQWLCIVPVAVMVAIGLGRLILTFRRIF